MADAHPDPLRTALCQRLGMARPVMSSGMGSVALAPLVAAVSNAGGLGILAGLNLPLAVLESQIAEVRAATDKPFGINLWLHRDLQPPLPPTSLDENLVGQAQEALNRVRATAGMPTIPDGTGLEPAPDLLPEAIEMVLAARPAVFSIGLGRPGAELVGRCHERGISVMAMATTVADGLVLADDGVDIIVAQGAEAGGHRSTWEKRPPDTCSVGLVALVPAMVDALGARDRSGDGGRGDTGPAVVAAGGIADGRGLVAALALGAQAILLGTRFVATAESRAAGFWKQRLVEAHGEQTVVSDAFTGYHTRVLANTITEHHHGPVLPSLLQPKLAADLYRQGDPELFPMHAGQSVELITDLPGAAQVVTRICAEAEAVLTRLR